MIIPFLSNVSSSSSGSFLEHVSFRISNVWVYVSFRLALAKYSSDLRNTINIKLLILHTT